MHRSRAGGLLDSGESETRGISTFGPKFRRPRMVCGTPASVSFIMIRVLWLRERERQGRATPELYSVCHRAKRPLAAAFDRPATADHFEIINVLGILRETTLTNVSDQLTNTRRTPMRSVHGVTKCAPVSGFYPSSYKVRGCEPCRLSASTFIR